MEAPAEMSCSSDSYWDQNDPAESMIAMEFVTIHYTCVNKGRRDVKKLQDFVAP